MLVSLVPIRFVCCECVFFSLSFSLVLSSQPKRYLPSTNRAQISKKKHFLYSTTDADCIFEWSGPFLPFSPSLPHLCHAVMLLLLLCNLLLHQHLSVKRDESGFIRMKTVGCYGSMHSKMFCTVSHTIYNRMNVEHRKIPTT